MGKKLNQDATAVENILALYTLLLFENKKYSLTELTKKFNVVKSTMSRYILQLEKSNFGKIQVEKRGREHIYWLDRPKSLPKISLSVEGLQQLALCRDFMLHLLPASMQQNVDTALQQATAYLPQDSTKKLEEQVNLHSIGRSFTKGHIDYAPFQDSLKIIMQAIRDDDVCTITYKKNRTEPANTYDYAPKGLVSFKEAIHISGWKVTDKGTVKIIKKHSTNLLLHRITKVELTKRSSEKLPKVEEISKGSFGYMEDSSFEAVIKFVPDAATYVGERIWSPDQTIIDHEDGGITLKLNVRSFHEFRSWVLGFGENAEVLSPDWAREEMLGVAESLYEIYDDGDDETDCDETNIADDKNNNGNSSG